MMAMNSYRMADAMPRRPVDADYGNEINKMIQSLTNN